MKRLMLHIGLPKTGSTFIQEWAETNRAHLLQQGIYSLPSLRAHRIGVQAITEESRLVRSDILSIKDTEWLSISVADAQQHPTAATLISSEYLSESDPMALASCLRHFGFDVVKVFGYLRRQDRICASGYAQEVKALRRATPPEDVVAYSELLNWELLHDRWQSAFLTADIEFRNFDKTRGNLIGNFASSMDIDMGGMSPLSSPSNLSLSARMTEIARLLNVEGLQFDAEQLREVDIDGAPTPYSFSPQITSQFEKLFRSSNERFAARFGDEFADFASQDWVPLGEDLSGRIQPCEVLKLIETLRLGCLN